MCQDFLNISGTPHVNIYYDIMPIGMQLSLIKVSRFFIYIIIELGWKVQVDINFIISEPRCLKLQDR